ncbi:hypothetical protein DP939_01150 [Spongiactinospora rosea]|uniref:Uncharacterized protein n=1 Tax=Spongiactinospora rosea TaxID=2248750 RepID=A0A366M565_9ACTN|nr:hypothetical protein DP939_01150 [Spongiactinospora rosea]
MANSAWPSVWAVMASKSAIAEISVPAMDQPGATKSLQGSGSQVGPGGRIFVASFGDWQAR